LATESEFVGAEELGIGEVGVARREEARFDLEGLIKDGEGGGVTGAGKGVALAVEGLGIFERLGGGREG